LNSDVRFVLMLAIIIASAIMGKPNLTTCPKNRKHYTQTVELFVAYGAITLKNVDLFIRELWYFYRNQMVSIGVEIGHRKS
jgi:hypothetical protein